METLDIRNADILSIINISRISGAFRFVNAANYFMLIGCGSSVVGAIGQLFMASAADLVAIVLAVLVFGFSAWVGWRNIGVLGAVIHGYTKPAMILLAVFTALATLGIWQSVKVEGDMSRDSFLGLFNCVILSLSATCGLLALTVLGRTRIPALDMSLRGLLLQSLGAQEKATSHRLPPANPRKGILVGLLGVGWLLGLQSIPSSLIPDSMQQQFWRISQIGYFFLIYARHFFQSSFESVMANDKRPPVVFLRSFADDEKVDYNKADSVLFDFSLESRLAAHFNSVGPFIAFGAPGDTEPHLGAVRASVSDDQWQGSVIDWMEQALLIVVMVGTTPWICWELRKIVALSFVDKIIIVFPQVKTSIWKRDVSSDQRLTVLVEVFSGTPWAAGLARIVGSVRPKHIRSVTLRPNGTVLCVTPRNRESYHLAALIAQYVKMQDHGEVPTAALAVKPRRWLRIAAWVTASVATLLILLIAFGLYELKQEAAAFEPLPVSIPVTTTGALRVGNFHFVERQSGPTRSSNFKPGDKVQISYDIQGASIGADEYPYVETEAILLNAAGEHVSDPIVTKFHQAIKPGERINSWCAWEMAFSASSGDYRIDIKLRDVVANTSLMFQPQFRLEEMSLE